MHAGARSVDEFVQGPVVVLAQLFWVGDVEPERVDVGGLVTLREIGRQVAVGHQMEHADFHEVTSAWSCARAVGWVSRTSRLLAADLCGVTHHVTAGRVAVGYAIEPALL